MPSNSSNKSNKQAASASADSGDEEHFADAQVVINTGTNLRDLIKRKNTYVKSRITMAENYLNTLDKRPSNSLREPDSDTMEQHLKTVQKATQAICDIVETSSHLMDPAEIETFLALVDEHTPRVSDITARIAILKDHVMHNTTMPPPSAFAQQLPAPTKKIDRTFRPDPLDEDATPEVFDLWRKQFEVFIQRNGLENAPLNEQRLLVDMCLTQAMRKTLSRVCLADSAKSMDEIVKKLEAFVLKSTSLVTRRYNFFNCLQNETETVQQYIVRFRGYGDYASLDKLSYEDLMACRIITGVRDENLRTELLRLPKFDFDSINDFATSWEYSRSNATQYRSANPNSINKVSAYKNEKKKQFRSQFQSFGHNNQSRPQTSDSRPPPDYPISELNPCMYCGLPAHPPSGCQARGQQCSFCKIMGHFARVCKKKQRAMRNGRGREQLSNKHVRNLETDQDAADQEVSDDSEASDNAISTLFSLLAPPMTIREQQHRPSSPTVSRPTPRIKASFYMEHTYLGDVHILPDTGAAVSVLPQSLATSWGLIDSLSANGLTPLKSVDGSTVMCLGTIVLSVFVQGSMVSVFFFVCPQVKTVIMSWHALHSLGAVPQHFPNLRPMIATMEDNQVFFPQSIKKQFVNAYPKVFNSSEKLNCMNGEEMTIYLRDSIDWPNVTQVYKPRPIPIALRQATKEQLDLMVRKDIIRPVSCPTMFTSPLLVVPKKDNKVRLVVDYTQLNKYVKRPIHPFPSVLEVRTMIPASAKYFATLDALQGYWQIPLKSDSQLLTTFITPWGRFCYTRAPMGLASSGDEFCRRGDSAFKDIDGVIKVVDDLLLYASTKQELEKVLHNVMSAAMRAGITLSADKFHIGTSVPFIGLNISSHGIHPDPRHTQAISDFPKPNNRMDLRSFLGLVNQFSTFSKSIATLSKSLRPLLSTSSDWHWTNEHEASFQSLKKTLSQSPVLKYFDPRLPTRLVTDASRLNGLGFALLQKHDDKWALVSCGSRYVTPTEANYAVIELEALAIAWAVQKCRVYLMGMPKFDVVTDHRPLVSVFNSSRLANNENPRLLRIMQKVSAYNFIVYWTPGRMHSLPDALSRSPLVAALDDIADQHDITLQDPALKTIIHHANDCSQYRSFREAVSRWPLKHIRKLPAATHGHIRAYSSVWDRLSIDPDSGLIVMDSSKIFVPASYRKTLLSLAHASHQGVSRTKERMQNLYFWNGMSNDIIQMLQACNLCQKFRPSQPEQPIQSHPVPSAPFRAVSCDLFEYGGSYTLTLVDRFSGFPLVAHFNKSPSSQHLIRTLSSFFKDFGIPTSLRHDGATPFVSASFKEFLKTHNIADELSSAYHPRSNGHAEASVKAMKQLVKKCWLNRQLDHISFNNSLLEWRNTPRYPSQFSPAQLLFGRNLRTLLPAMTYNNVSHSDIKKAVEQNYAHIKRQYSTFNSRKTHLRPLMVGDQVRIQNPLSKLWDKLGTITEARADGFSYVVQCQEKSYLRNRKFLKKFFGAMK